MRLNKLKASIGVTAVVMLCSGLCCGCGGDATSKTSSKADESSISTQAQTEVETTEAETTETTTTESVTETTIQMADVEAILEETKSSAFVIKDMKITDNGTEFTCVYENNRDEAVSIIDAQLAVNGIPLDNTVFMWYIDADAKEKVEKEINLVGVLLDEKDILKFTGTAKAEDRITEIEKVETTIQVRDVL